MIQEDRDQCNSFFKVSSCITSTEIPLFKKNHMAKGRVNMRREDISELTWVGLSITEDIYQEPLLSSHA